MKPWQIPQESCCSIYLVDLKWIFLLRLLKISYSQVISFCVTKCWICCLVATRAPSMLMTNVCCWLYVDDNFLLFETESRYWWHFWGPRECWKKNGQIHLQNRLRYRLQHWYSPYHKFSSQVFELFNTWEWKKILGLSLFDYNIFSNKTCSWLDLIKFSKQRLEKFQASKLWMKPILVWTFVTRVASILSGSIFDFELSQIGNWTNVWILRKRDLRFWKKLSWNAIIG